MKTFTELAVALILLIIPFGISANNEGKKIKASKKTEKHLSPQQMYENGMDAYRANDFDTAMKWYHKAADKGYNKAQHRIGVINYYGLGIKKDVEEALKWYRKAAKNGDVEAAYDLGNVYYNGYYVRKDYKEAAKWFLMGAERGSAKCQCQLGVMYQCGDGVPKDDVEAKKWYRKAAEQGYEPAKDALKFLL